MDIPGFKVKVEDSRLTTTCGYYVSKVFEIHHIYNDDYFLVYCKKAEKFEYVAIDNCKLIWSNIDD